MFYDMWSSSFESNVFIALINIAHENINLHLITDLNIGIDHWLLSSLGSTYEEHLRIRLGHQFLLQGDIWQCYCICETTVSISYHSTYS
jgi:hypothetical protein